MSAPNYTCPKCGNAERLEVTAHFAPSTYMRVALTTKDEHLSLVEVGHVMSSVHRLYKALGKQEGGDVTTFLVDFAIEAGEVSFGFNIVRLAQPPAAGGAESRPAPDAGGKA